MKGRGLGKGGGFAPSLKSPPLLWGEDEKKSQREV